MNTLIFRTLAVASLVFMGSGCSETLPPLDEAQDATVGEAKIAAHPHNELSPGKPSVPVTIDCAFLNEPAGEQPLKIRLNVSASGATQLDMHMKTRGNLALSKNTPQAVPLKSAGDQSEAYEAVVIASEEGRSYLNVQISGFYENQPFTKAISIPVQVGVGGPVLEKNGEIIDTGVEVLSSMPAKQTVTLKETENP